MNEQQHRAKVLCLAPAPPPRELSEPNMVLVSQLESLLEEARKGRLRLFAAALVFDPGGSGFAYSLPGGESDPVKLLGELELVKRVVMDVASDMSAIEHSISL